MGVELPQISFGGGTLSELVRVRIDLQKFGSGASDLTNFFVHAEGGASNRPGKEFIHEVKDSSKYTRSITFEFNEVQAYMLEFGDQYIRVVKDGGIVVEANKGTTDIALSNPVTVTAPAHGYAGGNDIYLNNILGTEELNGRHFLISNVTTNTFDLTGIDGTNLTPYVSGGDAARIYELATPYLENELPLVKYRQSNDVMYLTHRNHQPRELARNDHDDWTLIPIVFAPKQAAPATVTVTNEGTAGSTTYEYLVTAVGEDTSEESVTTSGTTATGPADLDDTNFNRITWDVALDAGKYNVYKEDNGLFGYIGSSETLQFDDTNYAPDLTDTAPKQRDPFDSPGNYPGAVGLHEQRSVWGNTDNKPLTEWLSQSGQFENMNVSSPLKDSDALTLRLVTGKGNEIRHFRSHKDKLFVFTSGVVWTLSPGGQTDAITPSSKKLDIEEYLSSSDTPPLTIKANLLMVAGKQSQGYEVYALGYTLQTNNYTGSDLTALAKDLFEGFTITDWDFIARPYRLVCACRSDGKMVVMTYLEEHQVYAWTVWETDGEYESCTSVPEGQEDALYVIVKRTIEGQTRRYIERLHTRRFTEAKDAFFVDSGLTYSGVPVDTVIGLGHLEGKEVIALADGGLVTGLTVEDGRVKFDQKYSEIHVGLGYDGRFESLPLNLPDGRTMGRVKRPGEVTAKVQKTRGLMVGWIDEQGVEHLNDLDPRSDEDWDTPPRLKAQSHKYKIGGDWNVDSGFVARTTPGLPATIASLTTDIAVGG